MTIAEPCVWDATEVILKASMQDREHSVLMAWARGYRLAYAPCFPRLHVITDKEQFGKARKALYGVPNVTLRDNNFSPMVVQAGTYIIIQWHVLWADNFTQAPYVHFYDVDAVPILPLRCQHFFDHEERLLLHAWRYPSPTHWVRPDSAVFLSAQQRGKVFRRSFTPGNG